MILPSKDDIEYQLEISQIEIKANNKNPREVWREAFKEAYGKRSPELLIDDNIDLDMADWEWD